MRVPNAVSDTDFIAAGGPDGYAYNVVRSESDDLIFKRAAKSGSQTFDETKVESLEFMPTEEGWENGLTNPGRPVSATWSRKDGNSGVIKFDDIIDARGRVGVVTTKYFKNRNYNECLKNVATWGTSRTLDFMAWAPIKKASHISSLWAVNSLAITIITFLEDTNTFVSDLSGWVWTIPLHNGTTSVGVVRNQAVATQRKRGMGSPSRKDYYLDCLAGAPGILKVLGMASSSPTSRMHPTGPTALVTMPARTYAWLVMPVASSTISSRPVSIWPSPAVSPLHQRSVQPEEETAMRQPLRSGTLKEVAEGYTRFLLVVLSALKQIRESDETVLSDFDED